MSGPYVQATFVHGTRNPVGFANNPPPRMPVEPETGAALRRARAVERSICAIRSLPPTHSHGGRTLQRRFHPSRGQWCERLCRPANDNWPGTSQRAIQGRNLILAAAWRLVLGAGCIGLIAVGSGLMANVQSLP